VAARDLWHVGLVVRDLDEAISFYTEALGLELRHRQTQENEYTCALVGYDNARLHVAQLRLPAGQWNRSGHIVELVEYERPPGIPGEPENRRLGTVHLAFEVDDIDEVRARLEARGASFHGPTQEIAAGINKGGKAVYLRDPDGNNLELIQPPANPGVPSTEGGGQ
jgi:catechol 2,3-dioxygenase-like lactoylglutathione lyase family enzyme